MALSPCSSLFFSFLLPTPHKPLFTRIRENRSTCCLLGDTSSHRVPLRQTYLDRLNSSISLFRFAGTSSAMIDTTEAWIDFVLQHGSFIVLLGVPALVAIFMIEIRINRLRKLEPHPYGRTELIFWPSQIFISLACLSLVGLVVALGTETADGVWGATFLMLYSWVNNTSLIPVVDPGHSTRPQILTSTKKQHIVYRSGLCS